MKIYGDIFMEGDVVNFKAAKDQRTQQQIDDTNRKIEALKSEQFANIDLAVAATIDKLADRGMSHKDAVAIVYKHLGDLVMAYDLGGDFD